MCRSGCAFQPDARKPLYVDGLICYHSCCQTISIKIKASGVEVENAQPDFTSFKSVSALLPPFLEGVSERSERECGLSV